MEGEGGGRHGGNVSRMEGEEELKGGRINRRERNVRSLCVDAVKRTRQ